MIEYLAAFLILLVAALLVYMFYERLYRQETKEGSTLYSEALADLLNGRMEKAFSKLRQVVSEDSANVDAYLRLGQILREYRQPERALQIHRDLTLRAGLNADQKASILEQLASDYLVMNNHDMAEAALKELRVLEPRNRWAADTLLTLLQRQKKWEEALEMASAVIKQEGSKSKKPLAVFKYQMGDDLYKKRDYHKARVLFKEAIGFDSQYVEAYLAVGDSYHDERRYEDAVGFWSKLIEAVPSQGHIVIGRLKTTLFELGRYGDLVGICEQIIQHAPENVDARLTLADIHAKKGDLSQAAEILSRVVDEHPEHQRAMVQLIRLYLEKGDRHRLDSLFRTLERSWEKASKAKPEPAKSDSVPVSSLA